jgi:hypothetical protein
MPLLASDEEPTVVDGNVQFIMLDGAKQVVCIVSGEALERLEGRPAATDEEKIEHYYWNSKRINQAASDKYDAGVSLPIVTSADL